MGISSIRRVLSHSFRRYACVLIGAVLAVLAAPSAGQSVECRHPAGNVPLAPFGDVNASGSANVADVMCVILASSSALAGEPPPECLVGDTVYADVNCDGVPTVADATLLLVWVLQGVLPPEVDSASDGCPDACSPCAPLGTGSCLIAGACYPLGSLHPEIGCWECDPEFNTLGWSVVMGTCPGGAPCSAASECISGLCELNICGSPQCSPTCNNGGVCNEYGVCNCQGTGYGGADCVSPICSPPCFNGGLCAGPNQCDCGGTGYSGNYCETLTVTYAWGNWSGWSNCSATCGGGTQTRTRECLASPGGAVSSSFCVGAHTESQPCNTQACPGPCVASSNNFQGSRTCTSSSPVTPGGWLNMPRPFTPAECRAFCDLHGATCCMHLKSGSVNGVSFANGGNMCAGSKATGLTVYNAIDGPLWTAMLCN